MSMPPRNATPHQTPVRQSDAPRDQADVEGLAGRRTYRPPAIRNVLTAEQLLEILGPAQASYGGSGMP